MLALVLMLTLADGAAFTGTWKGRISDLKCGAQVDGVNHKRCIEEGQQAVLVDDENGDVKPITNSDFVKNYSGAHVEVKGTSKDGQITVRDVKPLDK